MGSASPPMESASPPMESASPPMESASPYRSSTACMRHKNLFPREADYPLLRRADNKFSPGNA